MVSQNGKTRPECFKKHEHCERHKHAETMHPNFVSIQSKQNNSIVTGFGNVSNTEIKSNRHHVKILSRATSFLGRQSLAFRDHNEKNDSAKRAIL